MSEIINKLRAFNLKVGDIIETTLVGAELQAEKWKINKEFLEWINKDEEPHKGPTGLITAELSDFDDFEKLITKSTELGGDIYHTEGIFYNDKGFDPFNGMHPDHITDIKLVIR